MMDKKPMMFQNFSQNVNYTILDCKWIRNTAKFLTLGTNEKGQGILDIYELNESRADLVKHVEKQNAFRCCTFGASSLQNHHLAVGNFSGRMQIFDIENPQIPVYNVDAHKAVINAIDGIGGNGSEHCRAPEILTGSRDGTVKVWDPRQPYEPVIDISPDGENDTDYRDCWSVCFGNSYSDHERHVCSGYDNGDIRLFDLRTLSVIWETSLNDAITSIEYDCRYNCMNTLVASTLDGELYVYDMKTINKEKGISYVCQKKFDKKLEAITSNDNEQPTAIWTVKHLSQKKNLCVSAEGNGIIRLWKYHHSTKTKDDLEVNESPFLEMLHQLPLSDQPINCFDLSLDRPGLGIAGSLDQTFRVILTTQLNLKLS